MSTPKAAALALIEKLPDDATWHAILAKVAFRVRVEEALADSAAGRVISNEQLWEEVDEWLASPGPTEPVANSAGP